MLLFSACRKNLTHERWISNASSDTVYVWNPDFEDTFYVIAPAQKAMIYAYEVLDSKQEESQACAWMGDTLLIQNIKDSVCTKPISREYNWQSTLTGKKQRKQVCTFLIEDSNF
jgi:hypothetical protein